MAMPVHNTISWPRCHTHQPPTQSVANLDNPGGIGPGPAEFAGPLVPTVREWVPDADDKPGMSPTFDFDAALAPETRFNSLEHACLRNYVAVDGSEAR